MIFIFEDKEIDLLSKLFKSAYNDSSYFIYANGNGNLVNITEKCVNKYSDIIVVYLDTIPDNKCTADIYGDLRRLSIRNNFRVIVLPIICAEYYFINSLPDKYFYDYSLVDVCMSKSYWRDLNFTDEEDKKFVKNFEKFCKLILLKNVKDCIKHTRFKDNSNKLYSYYYCKDCLCNCSDFDCDVLSLVDKAINFVHKYPFFPVYDFIGDFESVDTDEVWSIHKRLVDDYNSFVDTYKIANSNYSYKKLKYIKE